MNLKEELAEKIWRAESLRATGHDRLVSWAEAPVSDHEKYRGFADVVLDTVLKSAAWTAKNWLENWSHDLDSTRDDYIDAIKSGRFAGSGRKIDPATATRYAKEFGERSQAVWDCAEHVEKAILGLKGVENVRT